jgi:hypothetical protein
MGGGWTGVKSMRLEMAVSRCGHEWVTIIEDPRFGLTDFTLAVKFLERCKN